MSSLKLEKMDEIRTLLDVSKRLRSIVPKYREAIADSRCDKHGLTFNAGSDSFSAFKCTIGLECYTGYYGSSSCGTMGSVDSKYAQKFLIKYLNKHMQEVFDEMADYAESSAAELKAEAQKEIDSAIHVLESIS